MQCFRKSCTFALGVFESLATSKVNEAELSGSLSIVGVDMESDYSVASG